MRVSPQDNRRWRDQRRLAWLAAFALGLAVVVSWWAARDRSFAQRFEERVRVAIPPGTPREQAEAWIGQNSKYLPTTLREVEAQQFQGASVPTLAGVDAASLRGIVRATVPREDWVAEVSPDHLWVFLLLDKQDKVAGYYFLTFRELAAMEARNRGRRG